MLNTPNRITLLRIFMIPFFVFTLFYWPPDTHFFHYIPAALFILASATDALDGYLAQTRNQKTNLGRLLDPIADKLLLVSAFLGLAFLNSVPPIYRIPIWLTLAVLSRDILIILGAVLIYMNDRKFVPSPNGLGKVTTFFQMATVGITLLFSSYGAFHLSLITLMLTLVSCVVYVRGGTLKLSSWGV